MASFRFKTLVAALLMWSAQCGFCAEAVYNAGIESKKIMQCTQDVLGQKIAYPSAAHPEVTGLRVSIPAGQETGWHTHSVPGYAYVLSGTITLEYAGGTKRQFSAGDAFAEVVTVAHNGRNAGKEDIQLVVFFTGDAGVPFTSKVEK